MDQFSTASETKSAEAGSEQLTRRLADLEERRQSELAAVTRQLEILSAERDRLMKIGETPIVQFGGPRAIGSNQRSY